MRDVLWGQQCWWVALVLGLVLCGSVNPHPATQGGPSSPCQEVCPDVCGREAQAAPSSDRPAAVRHSRCPPPPSALVQVILEEPLSALVSGQVRLSSWAVSAGGGEAMLLGKEPPAGQPGSLTNSCLFPPPQNSIPFEHHGK